MTNPSELRRAAVLIASLEESSAQALLAKFPPAMAGAVRKAARELGDVSSEERRQVLREFMQASGMEEEEGEGGVELDFSLADKLEHGYEDPPARVAPPEPATPFRFLHEARVEQLVRLLAGERPQLIALVMAHMPAEKAAATLGRLHKSQQAEVLTRLAELEEASPEALAEIELELQELLAEKHRVIEKRAAGFAAVSAILGAAGNSDRQSLLASLADRDSALLARLGYPSTDEPLAELAGGHAQAIRRALKAQEDTTQDDSRAKTARMRFGLTTGSTRLPTQETAKARYELPTKVETFRASKSASPNEFETEPAMAFADLARLDSGTLARVLSRADRHVLHLALSGAEDSLIERMTAGLSRGEVRGLRRQLMTIGPVRLSDVEAAQEELASLAERLLRPGNSQTHTATTTLVTG